MDDGGLIYGNLAKTSFCVCISMAVEFLQNFIKFHEYWSNIDGIVAIIMIFGKRKLEWYLMWDIHYDMHCAMSASVSVAEFA